MKTVPRPTSLAARLAAWAESLRGRAEDEPPNESPEDLLAELEAQQAELEQLLEEVTQQRDLLEQREAELLEERKRRLEAFRAVGQAVRASRDVAALARLLAAAATELTRARGACVMLRRPGSPPELEIVGGGGIAAELVGKRFEPEGSISMRAVRARRPLLVPAHTAHPIFAGFIARHAVERILVTAIEGEPGEPAGAFMVMDPRDASDDTVETLAALAEQASAGLESMRRAAEAERLGRRSRLLVAAMSRMPAAVLIADAGGAVRYANRAAAALCGDPRPRDLLGRDLDELFASELPPAVHARLAAGARPADWSGELLLRRRDGTLVPVHVTCVSVHRNGRAPGTVLLVRDVTSEKREQAQLMESDRLALIGGLVSGVAHELNNPLGAIGNFAELLLAGELDPDSREMVETIGREAVRAGEIVRNLLGFARRNEGVRQEVSLGDVVKRTLSLRVYDQRKNRIEVDLDLPSDLPTVWGNANQLQQVLLNLVVNAEQAIGRDGRIVIRGRTDGDMVELAVEDTGPGIPQEVRPHLFTPFFTTKPAGTGTGLGLAISRRIVDAHGGTIEASDAEGGGARFTIRLPRHAAG
ncbi:MAG TPA: ATP-binding protein [Longimicrobiales bacterium]